MEESAAFLSSLVDHRTVLWGRVFLLMFGYKLLASPVNPLSWILPPEAT